MKKSGLSLSYGVQCRGGEGQTQRSPRDKPKWNSPWGVGKIKAYEVLQTLQDGGTRTAVRCNLRNDERSPLNSILGRVRDGSSWVRSIFSVLRIGMGREKRSTKIWRSAGVTGGCQLDADKVLSPPICLTTKRRACSQDRVIPRPPRWISKRKFSSVRCRS